MQEGEVKPRMRSGPRLWFWMAEGAAAERESEGPALREPEPPADGAAVGPAQRAEVQRD